MFKQGRSSRHDAADPSARRSSRKPVASLVALAFSLGLMAAGTVSANAATVAPIHRTGAAAVQSISPALQKPQVCTIQTLNGHYLTAVGAGGRTTDVLHTDATRVGSWEKFTLTDSGDDGPNGDFIKWGIRTASGNYLSAVGGGGRITDTIHSDATALRGWEKFTITSVGNALYSIQTSNGHYLTAVGGGNRITDTIHTDATHVSGWEKFVIGCDY